MFIKFILITVFFNHCFVYGCIPPLAVGYNGFWTSMVWIGIMATWINDLAWVFLNLFVTQSHL